jgi:FAD/FMN-containing dehydrogenase
MEFLAELARRLPEDALRTDAADLESYGRDWTRVYAPKPRAIVFPRSTAEVAAVLALCNAERVPVVPSGGRTGLAGGAVAAHGEVVLSLEKMRRMDPVDEVGSTVRVQAGAVTEAVHRHCAAHGLTWPVDFASKGSSQVGGNISTNAGGVRVIRYGLTRNWVLGLQVVTATGEILELNGALEKNNTGLDLRQLFIGSEGTLGVVTEATLKLTRLPKKSDVMLFAVPDLAGVLRLFFAARRAPFVLGAFEMFTDKCAARVERHRKLHVPLAQKASHYVLVESEDASVATLDAFMGSLVEDGLALDGVRAASSTQAAELWSLRESIAESLVSTGTAHKNDISLPIASLEAFCAEFYAVFARDYPGWEVCVFGHIGDGNLHVNVMKPDALDIAAFRTQTAAADRDLFTLVQKHRGSISAEHGIGLLKKPYLNYSRSPSELAMLRAVKSVLDPNNILNPGKIFD